MSRYDPDDMDQVAEQQTSTDLAQQQQSADWRWFASTPQGRRVLNELISASGLMYPSFSDNALTMARNEGRRSIGAHIYARITSVAEGADRTVLIAEMVSPPDVRRARPATSRSTRSDR